MDEKNLTINEVKEEFSFEEDDDSLSRNTSVDNDIFYQDMIEYRGRKSTVHKRSKFKERCMQIKSFLRLISVGKYEMKLYHRGSDDLSSSFGGMLTIVVLITVTYFAL